MSVLTEHVTFRPEPDHFSRTERRLHAAMAQAYDVDARDVDGLVAIAEQWKPFRSWIGVLFRARLASSSPGSHAGDAR